MLFKCLFDCYWVFRSQQNPNLLFSMPDPIDSTIRPTYSSFRSIYFSHSSMSLIPLSSIQSSVNGYLDCRYCNILSSTRDFPFPLSNCCIVAAKSEEIRRFLSSIHQRWWRWRESVVVRRTSRTGGESRSRLCRVHWRRGLA